MKKKIAFIVTVPLTAKAFLMDHFKSLLEIYDVHLICNFLSEENKDDFLKIGLKCHSIPIRRSISPFSDFITIFKLILIVKRNKFLSIHSVTPKAGLLSAITGFICKTPYRIHIFTGQVWATKKGLIRYLLRFLDKFIVWLNTDILVDGHSQRQFLIDESVIKASNSKVLAYGSISGVHLKNFIISDKIREVERTKFSFSDRDVVFIFLGRLNRDKGIDQLYEAFNRMVKDMPHSKLIFYGIDEENYIDKAKSYPNIIINENFFFPGLTKQPYSSLQVGDVFVLPTWREGFGTSVIEAQALCLPVITSDAYGVVDASVPNFTGLRFRVGDSLGLYECMKKYYNDPKLRKKHGEEGRKRVLEKFNSEVVCSAWVAFYKELLN